MKATYSNILNESDEFNERRQFSDGKISDIRSDVSKRLSVFGDDTTGVMCFCAGSLARGDAGNQSDLDLFAISEEKIPHLCKVRILSSLADCNDALGFDPLSNDGEYLEIHQFDVMRSVLGSREDDASNKFTTRMLLLLESRPLYNDALYLTMLESVVLMYARDQADHSGEFVPLYLINDLLRYWRTLCLNYEVIRTEKKPWRKKNVNLKFCRMLTVFSAIVPAVFCEGIDYGGWVRYLQLSPLERIAVVLDEKADDRFATDFREFVKIYFNVLSWKELKKDEIERFLDMPGQREAQKRMASEFSSFLYGVLHSDYVPKKMKRYLVI